jgi:hypothetical protein
MWLVLFSLRAHPRGLLSDQYDRCNQRATRNNKDTATLTATPADAPDSSFSSSFRCLTSRQLAYFIGDELRRTVACRLALGSDDPETLDVSDGLTLPVGVGISLIVSNGLWHRFEPSDRKQSYSLQYRRSDILPHIFA